LCELLLVYLNMKKIESLSETSDKMLDPRELSYRLGNNVRRLIKKVLDNEQLDTNTRDELRTLIDMEDSNKQLLDYDTLTEIHKRLQRLDETYTMFFYQFLDDCKALAPRGKDNAELEARLQKLRQMESVRSYKTMTSSVASAKPDMVSDIRTDVQQLRPTLIAVGNSFLVIIGTFYFVFKAVEYASVNPNISVQVISGLIASTVVAIAELYFIMKIM